MSSKLPYTKEGLLPSPVEAAPAKQECSPPVRVAKILMWGLAVGASLNALGIIPDPEYPADALVKQCPQVSAVVPVKNSELWSSLGQTFVTDSFKSRAVEWLGGAVRVP